MAFVQVPEAKFKEFQKGLEVQYSLVLGSDKSTGTVWS